MLWDVIFISDDGLMIDTFGDYFDIMRYYIYFGVWMCEYFVITLYSNSLEVFRWGLLLMKGCDPWVLSHEG